MIFKAIYKVDGGKLIKISLLLDGEKIQNIKINGDFFIYPEEKIVDIENFLRKLSLDEKFLTKALNDFLEKEDINLFGIDAQSIVKTIFMAVKSTC